MALARKKVFLKSFGCQMNEYDSNLILELLRDSHEMEATNSAEEADLLLMNTCSVREKPQEKVFSLLGRWQTLKKRNPNVVIGVGGCVASQEGRALSDRAHCVDIVFGPQTLHRLPVMYEEAKSSRDTIVDVSFPAVEKFDNLPEPGVKGSCAFVTVMEGCGKFCSFCIVPYTRGPEVSRPLAGILDETRLLAAKGVREVTLLGQNVNAWRAPDDVSSARSGTVNFALLLYHIAGVPGIERIRFTSPHPLEFGDALIAAYADLPQLMDHVHLPVQSGSDRILVRMKRGYTVLEYKSIVRKLRKVRPKMAVSTDIIVGFPGESDADFNQTMRLVDEIGFDTSYSFLYSQRPGTPAARLADDVSLEVKKQRLGRLQRCLSRHVRRSSEMMVASVQDILVEARSKKSDNEWCGRTANNKMVNFPVAGEAGVHSCSVGSLVKVKIKEALANSLRGEICGA